MTVKELIEKLKALDQDAKVYVICDYDGSYIQAPEPNQVLMAYNETLKGHEQVVEGMKNYKKGINAVTIG